MNRSPAESIVQFLSFSAEHCDQGLVEIAQFSRRRWGRVLQWLDDAGLGFYFLQKLKDVNAVDTIPDSALNHLQQNFAANQLRVEDMSRRFDFINKKFNDAGIHYAVIKGFSLVPEFCPYSPLRHQGDLDYLVDDESLPAACQVLLEAGYISKESLSSVEKIFVIPGGKPSRGAEQYSPRAPHAVELHTNMWDGPMHQLPQIPNLFFLERAVNKQWNGLTFPALCEEDAFVLQILHTCQHLFTLWIRMSSLFEIGFFLHQRADDTEFWNRTAQGIGETPILRELTVVVVELVSRLFTTPLPAIFRAWAVNIRPESRVWIEHYARRCAFSELAFYQFRLFPTVKLVLFLQQQFRENTSRGKSVVRKRLLPSTRISHMASSLKNDPSLALQPSWWGHHMLVRRSIFHILADFRYFVEVPRWRWLNRNRVPIAS